MILRLGKTHVAWWLLVLVWTVIHTNAAEKTIRLRSGEFKTPDPAARRGPPDRQSARGLYLLQFETPPDPAARQTLAALGVRLLQYVPDDACVVRLLDTRPADVLALPFVRCLERYHAQLKVDRRLLPLRSRPAGATGAAEPAFEVAIVLAPDAEKAETEEAIRVLGAPTRQARHRFGTVVRGQLRASEVATLSESPSVVWIEPTSSVRLCDESASAIVGGPSNNHLTLTQRLGYDGSGVVVAVADSGLDNGRSTNHTELLGRTKALLAYGGLGTAADEHGHGTHVAGIIAGRGITGEGDDYGYYGLGVAPGAQLVIQRVFDQDGDYRSTPRDVLTRDAVRNGAIIGNNSWTAEAQGHYDVAAQQFDDLTRDADLDTPGDQPYLMIFAAGNAGPGPQTIGSPAVGKNVIAVGASQGPRSGFLTYDEGVAALAATSSRGPCDDGRIKPDLVAPGTWIASLFSVSGRVENVWAPINNEFAFMGGTSQSSPHVAGAAAVFVQYYRAQFSGTTPSPALIKGALINAAIDLESSSAVAAAPNMEEGWGRCDVARLVQPDRVFDFLDQQVRLATGQTYERSLFVVATNCPVTITLAYTDYPGFPGALPALVNDLDLELTAPDGRVYRGNQFAGGVSVPGAATRDGLNNIEGLRLLAPLTGEYRLRVRANRVSQDSCAETPEVDQDFALIASGSLKRPDESIILLDRATCRVPEPLRIKLFDADLGLTPTAVVTARSQTEPNGESVTLQFAGVAGTYTGLVKTATGPAIADDHVVQIAHGDWIRVEALSPSGANTRAATAVADLIAPVIVALSPTNSLGQQAIAWLTDEPASSIVRFGLAPNDLNRAVTNLTLTRSHLVEFGKLLPEVRYYFRVESVDGAGNVGTNTPGGEPDSFIALRAATVLLVDAYLASPPDPVVSLNAYTVPLAEIGLSYDTWSLSEIGALPELETLRRYPVVIWRINDSIGRPNDSIPPPQQEAIQEYLRSGGSFLLSSMNILSRLLQQNAGDFITNVLHIQRFTLNADRFRPCRNCDEDFGVPQAVGVSADAFAQGISLALNYDDYPIDGLMGPDWSDTFRPATNTVPFLLEATSGKVCGLRFPRIGDAGQGRVVFLAVPFDAIPETGEAPNNRTEILRRIMRFLAPGVGGGGTLGLAQGSYALPDIVTIELADSDLEGQGAATVTAASDTSPNAIPVLLAESVRPGLFRGTIAVRAGAESGALAASHGDRIYFTYTDASRGAEVRAEATVDSAPATINDLNVRAGYFDTVVQWSTSEPTDALIQFGESAFLDRTVYREDRQLSHNLRLVGLAPGRTYFLKITVRDGAGNITVSDNGGEFHSFSTREPMIPRPSWVDSLEAPESAEHWTVIASDDSQSQWSLGSPNDGHTVIPHSGLNVWASDLYGDPADIIDTYLISPGLDLRGANVAELKFYQNYLFTDQTGFDYINEGRLLIATNVQRDPVLLASYRGSTFDWTREEIDLTPYAGQVVFLVWHHQMRSTALFPPDQRSGWAIDDIEVSARNVPAGAIRITSNLSQARFTLRRGGLVRTGQGFSQLFTNLPPGDYEVSFDPVPFRLAPATRTSQLLAGRTNALIGNYSIVDANENSMSDSWELAQFGVVSPTRTRTTDTDGDGFPDLAEFTAGTDPLRQDSYLALATPLALSGPLLRFQWPSTPGRSYQLQGSTGDGGWIPMSSWIRALGDTAAVIIPPPAEGDPYLFRVEVQP